MASAEQLPEGTDQISNETAASEATSSNPRIAGELGKLRDQASEKAFAFANQGKDRATNALENKELTFLGWRGPKRAAKTIKRLAK